MDMFSRLHISCRGSCRRRNTIWKQQQHGYVDESPSRPKKLPGTTSPWPGQLAPTWTDCRLQQCRIKEVTGLQTRAPVGHTRLETEGREAPKRGDNQGSRLTRNQYNENAHCAFVSRGLEKATRENTAGKEWATLCTLAHLDHRSFLFTFDLVLLFCRTSGFFVSTCRHVSSSLHFLLRSSCR